MSTQLYTNAGALVIAADIQALLALSVLKLIQGPFTLTRSLTDTELDAMVATFGGYTAKTLTAWLNPYLDPALGASIQSPLVQFDSAAGTTNDVTGAWLETAGGDVVAVIQFDAAIPMGLDGQSLPINLALNFGA